MTSTIDDNGLRRPGSPRRAGTSTVVEWLDTSLPVSGQSLRVVSADGRPQERSWPAVYRSALCRAAALRSDLGVEPGDRIAVLGPTSLPLVETLLATWLTGATTVVLPLPLRFSSTASFGESTRARIAEAGARVVLVDPAHAGAEMADALPKLVRTEVIGAEPTAHRPADPIAVDPAATAVLQFTSGSTARPKAVQLSHRAVTANIRAMGEAAAFSAADQVVSWLPLYHDMGLIGSLLGPTLFGGGTTLLPTGVFMASPLMWMRTIELCRGTVTAAPNFAYALAGRLLARADPLDLSSVRVAFCGAEPIIPSTLVEFCDHGRRHGLPDDVILPCYGLAEATLAVSFAPLGRPLLVDTVDRAELQASGIARPVPGKGGQDTIGSITGTAAFVSLGLPLRGTAVRIVGPDGVERGERQLGELHVASWSLMDGYLNQPDGSLADGWLSTGDLGYVAEGEVYVCGRSKDLIIVNGHNIHPHEVESVAESVAGVRIGGTAAFAVGSIDGAGDTESFVVVCESRAEPDSQAAIATEVRRRVSEAIGVAPRDVRIVPPKQVPKTTSGKRQRQLARQLFLSGKLAPPAARPVGAPA